MTHFAPNSTQNAQPMSMRAGPLSDIHLSVLCFMFFSSATVATQRDSRDGCTVVKHCSTQFFWAFFIYILDKILKHERFKSSKHF